MKKYYIVLALALALFAFTAKSATTYTVYNVPPLRLSVGISGSQTANIKLSAPIRNGESVSYPALTGGILQLKNARFEEHIYYASGSVAASTLEVTLYGVVRGYCWNSNTFASCEAGRTWAKGTETTLVNDMRLFNFSMKKDLANTTSGSGAILCGSTANPCMFQGRYTTAQRDAFTWKGGAGEGTPIIHNTTTGTLQWWDGSTWTEIGDTGVANASEIVAGKAEAADFVEIANLDQTGATLALNFLTPRHLVKNGSGAVSANRIPLLNSNGVLQLSMGGNGTGGTLGIASGAILVYQRTTVPKALYPTAANQVITTTDGRNWIAATTAVPTTNVLNITTPVYRDDTGSLTGALLKYTITGGTITIGKTYAIAASGTGTSAGGNNRMHIMIGNGTSTGTTLVFNTSMTAAPWSMRARITFFGTGTNAKYSIWTEGMPSGTTLTQNLPATKTVGSTSTNITIQLQGSRDGAGNTQNMIYHGTVDRLN